METRNRRISRQCLQRELLEELNIHIDLPIPYQIVRHGYPDKIVELHFFRCAIEQGEPVLSAAKRSDGCSLKS